MTRRNRSRRSMHRRKQTSTWLAWVVGGLFTVVLTTSFFFDDMGVRKYLAMLKHERELAQEIRELERVNAELRLDVRRIQSDPARIEQLARERLGFVRKGETVYQAVPEQPAAPASR